jgi:hypothetical protein
MPRAEIQRRYRERLRQAGKAYKVTDLTQPDLALFVEYPDRLHDALRKLELRNQDVDRLTARNSYLEGELKLQERLLTNALKDNIVLKQQLAAQKPKRR